MSRRASITAAILVGSALVALGLTNSRVGVFIMLDLFDGGEENVVADPRQGPIELSEYAAAVPAYPLPVEIEQPSGIAHLGGDSGFAILTDQAELFLVPNDFQTVRSRTNLVGGLLLNRQGSMEAAASLGEDRVAVTGEMGGIGVWRWDGDAGFSQESEIGISGFGEEAEFSGIAYDPQRMEYYLAADDTLTIVVVDPVGRLMREIDLTMDDRVTEKPGRAIGEYQISGLDFSEGLLFAVTENYNTIFVIDPSDGIIRAIGVENGDQVSDIAMFGGRAYLTVDHNYFDERPPVLVVELEELEATSAL